MTILVCILTEWSEVPGIQPISPVMITNFNSNLLCHCLISGDESGMLEDMCVAVAELATVKFQVILFSKDFL